MLSVEIMTIPHEAQRYPTVGDWWWTGNVLHLRVSQLSCWQFEFLVATHELVEVFLCKAAAIAEGDVTRFNLMFEKEREAGKWSDEGEPGDDLRAPYRWQHQAATMIERMVAFLLRVDWTAYEAEITALP